LHILNCIENNSFFHFINISSKLCSILFSRNGKKWQILLVYQLILEIYCFFPIYSHLPNKRAGRDIFFCLLHEKVLQGGIIFSFITWKSVAGADYFFKNAKWACSFIRQVRVMFEQKNWAIFRYIFFTFLQNWSCSPDFGCFSMWILNVGIWKNLQTQFINLWRFIYFYIKEVFLNFLE
jgi:hypothetical protein